MTFKIALIDLDLKKGDKNSSFHLKLIYLENCK